MWNYPNAYVEEDVEKRLNNVEIVHLPVRKNILVGYDNENRKVLQSVSPTVARIIRNNDFKLFVE